MLTGINRSQISLLERGESKKPHAGTVGAYVKACGISDMQFQECLLNTIRLYEDPALTETLALEHRIAELQPRSSSGQRIDRSADIFAVGEELYEIASSSNRVRWTQLAAYADELNYRLYPAGTSPKTTDEGIFSAALFALERMCASEHDEDFAPEVALWRGHTEKLIARCLQADFFQSRIEASWVFKGVIPLARHQPAAFLRDQGAFEDQWAAAQLQLLSRATVDQGDMSESIVRPQTPSAEPDPVVSQLFGYSQLLAGVAEGVSGRVAEPTKHGDLVGAS